MELKQVEGENRGDVILYALSTCGWCRKTKQLLQDMGIAYRYVDVDLLPVREQQDIMAVISEKNPSGNFPTIIIDNDRCIIGFREAEIKEALNK